MKPIFKAEMFHKYYPHLMSAEQAAEQANAIAESWPVVYTKWTGPSGTHSWNDNKNTLWSSEATHRARLAFIEEIEKEPCKHKPKLISGSGFGVSLMLEGNTCRFCGIELVADWREKK